jgi:MFS family permease
METAMASDGETSGGRRASPWRIAAWSVAALLVLLPLVAMRFTDEVNWTGADFVFAAVLIGSVGIVFELTVRMSRNHAYRAGVGFALACAFLIVWANGAVGMIGNEDNPYNLLFGGVLLIALIGAVAAWFEPAGMARAMVAAALAQVAVAAGGLAADPLGAAFGMAFAGLWLLAAILFRKAARDRKAQGGVEDGDQARA